MSAYLAAVHFALALGYFSLGVLALLLPLKYKLINRDGIWLMVGICGQLIYMLASSARYLQSASVLLAADTKIDPSALLHLAVVDSLQLVGAFLASMVYVFKGDEIMEKMSDTYRRAKSRREGEKR